MTAGAQLEGPRRGEGRLGGSVGVVAGETVARLERGVQGCAGSPLPEVSVAGLAEARSRSPKEARLGRAVGLVAAAAAACENGRVDPRLAEFGLGPLVASKADPVLPVLEKPLGRSPMGIVAGTASALAEWRVRDGGLERPPLPLVTAQTELLLGRDEEPAHGGRMRGVAVEASLPFADGPVGGEEGSGLCFVATGAEGVHRTHEKGGVFRRVRIVAVPAGARFERSVPVRARPSHRVPIVAPLAERCSGLADLERRGRPGRGVAFPAGRARHRRVDGRQEKTRTIGTVRIVAPEAVGPSHPVASVLLERSLGGRIVAGKTERGRRLGKKRGL
jgi:hypothetical protein